MEFMYEEVGSCLEGGISVHMMGFCVQRMEFLCRLWSFCMTGWVSVCRGWGFCMKVGLLCIEGEFLCA